MYNKTLMEPSTQPPHPMDTTSLSNARSRLSEIVEDVIATGAEVVITKHGRPAAVVMGYEDHESLIETLNILSDAATMTALAEAEEDVASGNLEEL